MIKIKVVYLHCQTTTTGGMYRHLIKKSVDTGKPYKGILYKEEK